MNIDAARLLERSRREIEAAQTLLDGGFPEQAISRAYYAAFKAASAALLVLGETRSKHSGVQSAFGALVVKDGGVEPECGRILRRLFEWRNRADYEGAAVDDERSRASIAEAVRFVDAVEPWVRAR